MTDSPRSSDWTSLELVMDRTILFRAAVLDVDLYNSLRAANMSVFEARQDTAFGNPDKFSLVVLKNIYYDHFEDIGVGHFHISGLSPKADWRPTCGRSSINEEPKTEFPRSQQLSVTPAHWGSALARRTARQWESTMSQQWPIQESPAGVLGDIQPVGLTELGAAKQVKPTDALRAYPEMRHEKAQPKTISTRRTRPIQVTRQGPEFPVSKRTFKSMIMGLFNI